MDVVVGSLLQIAYFLVVHSLNRFGEKAVAARLHLYEDYRVTVEGNDVEVAVTTLPVALHYHVTLLPQVFRSDILAPAS